MIKIATRRKVYWRFYQNNVEGNEIMEIGILGIERKRKKALNDSHAK